MTWLAWRQFRTQALAALGLLGAFALTLLVTHPDLVPLFERVQHCKGQQACQSALAAFSAKDSVLRHLANALAVAVPAVLGVFWGAPLVARELETGSFRLAWTQSVTRSRWLAAKLAIVGTATVVAAGLFSWLVTWWSSLDDRLVGMPFAQFDSRGIVVIGYAAFGFALGVVLGAVIRRTIPAMATTLVVFFAARLTFSTLVRVHLLAPLQSSSPLGLAGRQTLATSAFSLSAAPSTGDWVTSSQVVTGSGRTVDPTSLGFGLHGDQLVLQGVGVCPHKVPAASLHSGQLPQSVFHACLASFHLRQVVTFQPPDRYWPLQWIELGVFLLVAAVLAATSTWWVRRRLS